jgi:hypothetical protein
MKKLFFYYILIFTPLLFLFWMNKSEFISPFYFVLFLFFYVFIYRTFTDGIRLFDKKIIQKKDIWKMIIPGSRIHYFKELYLK